MQYITVRITGPTHPYLDTQVAAAAMLLGNARILERRDSDDRQFLAFTTQDFITSLCNIVWRFFNRLGGHSLLKTLSYNYF